MSANATARAPGTTNVRLAAPTAKPVPDMEKGHRVRLFVGYMIAITLVVGIFAYGFNYYTLGASERPFSPKHALLKPSGAIGVKLGLLGLGMFLSIFLYPLRKHWAWLGRQGSSRHWLDNHVLLGLAAPFVIALHAAFKFRGFAGIAFWIMLAVSMSGVIGRYLYGQIPRSLNAAELSLKEVQDIQAKLGEQLAEQKILPESVRKRRLVSIKDGYIIINRKHDPYEIELSRCDSHAAILDWVRIRRQSKIQNPQSKIPRFSTC